MEGKKQVIMKRLEDLFGDFALFYEEEGKIKVLHSHDNDFKERVKSRFNELLDANQVNNEKGVKK